MQYQGKAIKLRALESGVVELCWRYSFRYERTRGQRRAAVLRPCEG